MKRVIALIIFILFSNYLFAKYPKVFVSTNPKSIKAGEKLEVIIGVVSKKGSKVVFPKITEIGGNKVVSKKALVSHSIKEIDGKKVPLTKRVLNLVINPSKSFNVNEFILKIDNKNYTTAPFRVEVNKKDIKQDNAYIEDNTSNGLIFKMSSSKKEVFVGESFIVKVELFEPLDYIDSDIQYNPPQFQGLKAQPLGDGKTIEQDKNLIRVIEYLVTPLHKGHFTIKPAIAKIGIQLTPQAQTPFGFFGNNMHYKTISTNSLQIDIKESPKDVDFIGLFRIKTIIDSKTAKANKPFNYTIEIDGIGDLKNIKEPEFKIAGITSYSDDSKIEHLLKKDKIYSKFSKKYIFISDKDFVIPSIKYKVFSPNSGKIYTIKTEAYHVKVKKSKSITEALSDSGLIPFNKIQNSKNEKNSSSTKEQKKKEEINKVENLLFDKFYYKRKYRVDGYPFSALIGAFLLGIILGMGSLILGNSIIKVVKKATGRDKEFSSYEEALKILYPHTTDNKSIEMMVENLYEIVNGNTDLKVDDYVLNQMIKRVKQKK